MMYLFTLSHKYIAFIEIVYQNIHRVIYQACSPPFFLYAFNRTLKQVAHNYPISYFQIPISCSYKEYPVL